MALVDSIGVGIYQVWRLGNNVKTNNEKTKQKTTWHDKLFKLFNLKNGVFWDVKVNNTIGI